jgi:two-component system sensor histidine kinase UhpB
MLDRLEAERREATGRVLAGQEAERLRIAQELHDQIGQELTAVLLGLARVHAGSEPAGRILVEEVQDAVRASLEDVRRIALELRPEALDELGLVSALAVLGERLAQRAGLTVEQTIDSSLPELDPDVELVVYRVAQEALTNVARHARVDRARLRVSLDAGTLTMEVSDAGRGRPADGTPSTGIRGMQERAALIGGRLEVGPGEHGRGCRVRLRVDPEALQPAAGTVASDDDPADDAHPAR